MSPPETKPKTGPRTATTFEKELWQFQNDAPKTPTSAMNNAGCVIGMGVFVWIAFFVYRFFGGSVEELFKASGLMGVVGILLMILATLAPVIGAVLLLVALIRPKRSVKCPYCLTDHRVHRAVQSYVCTGCASVLRFPAHTKTSDMVKLSCPACGTQWATTPDGGGMRCFSCGLPVEVKEGQIGVAGGALPCWSCGTEISEGLFFCRHCGCLVTEPIELAAYVVSTDLHEMVSKTLPPTTPDGMDVISLRPNSAIGFLIRSLWKAQSVLNKTLAATESGVGLLLAEQIPLLGALDDGVDFLNEAITIKPEFAAAVQSALPVYDACIGSLLARIEEKSHSGDASIVGVYERAAKTLTAKLNALLERLSEVLDLPPDRVGSQKWPEPLIDVTNSGSSVALRDSDTARAWFSQLTTPSQLKKVRVPEPALASIPGYRVNPAIGG